MTKLQLDNLIQFCFLFHPQCDCDWKSQSPSYLLEKWNKYIGIDVSHTDFDRSYLTNNTTTWIKFWKVSDEDWVKLKRVIRFIISLGEKPIISTGKYKTVWTLSELVDNFENQISPTNQIKTDSYNHAHELIRQEIKRWLETTENSREYSLNLILNK
jgi:hypothetical protein